MSHPSRAVTDRSSGDHRQPPSLRQTIASPIYNSARLRMRATLLTSVLIAIFAIACDDAAPTSLPATPAPTPGVGERLNAAATVAATRAGEPRFNFDAPSSDVNAMTVGARQAVLLASLVPDAPAQRAMLIFPEDF